MTLSLNWPSGLQTPDQQIDAMQKAFSDIQDNFNQFSTQPQVLVHLASAQNTTQYVVTGSYVTIPGFSKTINSQGGLVVVDATICGVFTDGYGASLQLLIDGRQMVVSTALQGSNSGTSNARAGQATFSWKAILGSGQHTIAIQATGINCTINGTARGAGTSAWSIIEFPANVSATS